MDQEELKAEVDAYMQDYDKKIAEVRPGWRGNPAKQSGEREDILGPRPQWKGQRETHWLAGLFYSHLLVGSQVLVGLQHLTLPPRAYNRYPQINWVLAGVQCCD